MIFSIILRCWVDLINIAMNLVTLLPDSMDSMQVAQRHTGEWRYLAKTEGEFRRVVRWRREAAWKLRALQTSASVCKYLQAFWTIIDDLDDLLFGHVWSRLMIWINLSHLVGYSSQNVVWELSGTTFCTVMFKESSWSWAILLYFWWSMWLGDLK